MVVGWQSRTFDLSLTGASHGKCLFSSQLPSEWLFTSHFLSLEDGLAWVAIFPKLHISSGIACLFLNGLPGG